MEDIKKDELRFFDAKWDTRSLSRPIDECLKYYASIAYIARVRTKAGRVVETSFPAVLQEARKFYRNLVPEKLEPTPEQTVVKGKYVL